MAKVFKSKAQWTVVLVVIFILLLILQPIMVSAQSPEVQIRIWAMTAEKKVETEMWGDDEISLGGTYTSKNQGTKKIPYLQVGQFQEGTTIRFDENPLVFAAVPLTSLPETLEVTFSLVEQDWGGKDKFLDNLYVQQRTGSTGALAAENQEDSTPSFVEEIILDALLHLSEESVHWLWNRLTGEGKDEPVEVQPVTTEMVEDALGTTEDTLPSDEKHPLLELLQQMAKQMVVFLWDAIKERLADDIFEVSTITVEVNSLSDFSSPAVHEVILEGHGGKYRIVYDWYVRR